MIFPCGKKRHRPRLQTEGKCKLNKRQSPFFHLFYSKHLLLEPFLLLLSLLSPDIILLLVQLSSGSSFEIATQLNFLVYSQQSLMLLFTKLSRHPGVSTAFVHKPTHQIRYVILKQRKALKTHPDWLPKIRISFAILLEATRARFAPENIVTVAGINQLK